MNPRITAEQIHSLTDKEVLYVAQEKFKRSLYDTCKTLLGMRDINPRTHGHVIELLQDDSIKKKLIVMPRGSLKSSICSVGYPIWKLLNDPNIRIMIDSSLYTNSRNFIKEIRGHFESSRLTGIYGQLKSDTNWSDGEITLKTRTKVLKEASVLASGVAANKVSVHVDYIIHDDLNTEDNSRTPELAVKVLDHYKRNISILEPDGTIVVVGTRYSALDVIASIIENEMQINLDQRKSTFSDIV
jgi:hypothetical protein